MSKRVRRRRSGSERSQAELGVSQLCGAFDVGFVNHDRNFDFRRRDQLNINPGLSKTIEEPCSYAGMRSHSNSDHT